MRYYVEESLSNFKFWSGGKDRADLLSDEQFDIVEQMLEEIEPEDGWSDSAINDMFWFDFDTIAEWLGYKNEEYLEKNVSNEDIENTNDWANSMMRSPIESEFKIMVEVSGLDDDDLEEYETDDEREGAIIDEFNDYWENLEDYEKVDIYNNYN